MLTTTVDGLWVLQVLSGVEVLAPELGLRPTLPSVESARIALQHPIAAELTTSGVIDAAGAVDAAVVEWLTVLSRRDVALVIWVRRPDDHEATRVLLARFARWWVVMERSADLIRIGGAGTASAEHGAKSLLGTQLERLCGVLDPAPLRPATVDGDALLAGVTNRDTLRGFLSSQRLDADQVHLLMTAADPQRSAQASIVALQAGIGTSHPNRTHVERTAVTVIDTPDGRVLAEYAPAAGKSWMIFAPGTTRNIVAAVDALLRRLPADRDWYSYRKVV